MQIIPVVIHKEPERCPKCHRVENIKEVCAECGYEYEQGDQSDSFMSIVFTTLAMIVAMAIAFWFGVTLMRWLSGTPLFRVLETQWQWLTSLKFF